MCGYGLSSPMDTVDVCFMLPPRPRFQDCPRLEQRHVFCPDCMLKGRIVRLFRDQFGDGYHCLECNHEFGRADLLKILGTSLQALKEEDENRLTARQLGL
ncbi:MAG: hypothetical protein AB7E47_03135 [Desulfovibrionaceae bacterium]